MRKGAGPPQVWGTNGGPYIESPPPDHRPEGFPAMLTVKMTEAPPRCQSLLSGNAIGCCVWGWP
jgi:hypothetical protein